MKVKIEIDLDNIFVDEMIPIYKQPILKAIKDIKRVEKLIEDKVSEDVRTSHVFNNLTYAQLEEEVLAWANKNKDWYRKNFLNIPKVNWDKKKM